MKKEQKIISYINITQEESENIQERTNKINPRYVVVSAPYDCNLKKSTITLLKKLDENLEDDNHNIRDRYFDLILENYIGIGDDRKLFELEHELEKRINQIKNKQRTDEILSFGEWATAKVLSTPLGLPFYDPKLFIAMKNGKIERTFNLSAVPEFAIIPSNYGSTLDGKIQRFKNTSNTGLVLAKTYNLENQIYICH